jgi:hypothetical protein
MITSVIFVTNIGGRNGGDTWSGREMMSPSPRSCCVRDVVHKAPQLLAKGKHAPAFALRWRARYHRVWNWVRSALRNGDAMATSFFGSLRSAWRRQVPRRAPGSSIRILRVGSPGVGAGELTVSRASQEILHSLELVLPMKIAR